MSDSFETEVGEPKKADKRSAFDVLRSLDGDPIKQALKFKQYCESADGRKARMGKLLSEKAVAFVTENYPGLLG